MLNRRNFLKTAAVATVSAIPLAASGRLLSSDEVPNSQGLDLLRPPDQISARFGAGDVIRMQYSAFAWTCPGIRVSAEPIHAGGHSELPIRVINEG